GERLTFTAAFPAVTTGTRRHRVACRSAAQCRATVRRDERGIGAAVNNEQWVVPFEKGSRDMLSLLGGKGTGLAEMTRAGLPVPPGFVITTAACGAYYEAGKVFPEGMWTESRNALHAVEEETGKGFGDATNPL